MIPFLLRVNGMVTGAKAKCRSTFSPWQIYRFGRHLKRVSRFAYSVDNWQCPKKENYASVKCIDIWSFGHLKVFELRQMCPMYPTSSANLIARTGQAKLSATSPRSAMKASAGRGSTRPCHPRHHPHKDRGRSQSKSPA